MDPNSQNNAQYSPEQAQVKSTSSLTNLRKHKLLVVLGVIILILLISLLAFSVMKSSSTPIAFPTPTPIIVQKPFKVVSTNPQANQTNVFAGELVITISTDVPIISPSSLSLTISPALKYNFEYKNSFPTQKIMLQALGGLKKNTTYQAVVKNKTGEEIYTWSFTTSSDQGQGQSAVSTYLDNKILDNYYPLSKYFPYATSDYKLGYVDHLKLKITLLHTDLDKDRVLSEVKDWVKSKGVDPNTHQYIFAN